MTSLISLITLLFMHAYTSTSTQDFPEYTETILAGEVLNTSKTYQGLPLFSTNDLQRPHRSRNVGRDTNNPGNLLNGQGS
ncbi:MAG: hypothetical protein LBO09_03555 [Candidatus Peribacteria bacterium]|jgi:hypothetical protein|nr:hypothetical protein [Candidatus Peribacteria bacterium]